MGESGPDIPEVLRRLADLDGEVGRLRGENDALRRQNEVLRKDNESLRRENESLRREIEGLREDRGELNRRIEELDRAGHRPVAPFRREQARKIPPDKRKKPGRKAGHVGVCRPKPDHVDRTVRVPLKCCPGCGGKVTRRRKLVQFIEELPVVRPLVVELVTERGRCGRCGDVRSTHPLQTSADGRAASGTMLGPRATGLCAMLNKELGLTMSATCRVVERLRGLKLSKGGLSQALDRAADRTAGEHAALTAEIRGSPAVFADETSWWVNEPGWWLWTFTTPAATLYRVEKRRNAAVVRDTLGPDFAGTLVSDCLASYDSPAYAKHKCIAHHQRAISEAKKLPTTADATYLDQWKRFFSGVTALWKSRTDIGPDEWPAKVRAAENWRDRLLVLPVTQPGDAAVRNRLLKQRDHLLGCLTNPAAEPTNNRAERSLRPAVIARKLSCGNRTDRGRRTWQTLASLAVTCRQKGVEFADWLADRMRLGGDDG